MLKGIACLMVQILNNATAEDLSGLGVQSLASHVGNVGTWYRHKVKAIAYASFQKEFQAIQSLDLPPGKLKMELKKLETQTQRALVVLNPANGDQFRVIVMNIKNLPEAVGKRITVSKLQRFINQLSLPPSAGIGSCISPTVVCMAFKALLLMNGYNTADNTKILLPTATEFVDVGFLPRTGGKAFPKLHEECAIEYMALGYAWRWKVRPIE